MRVELVLGSGPFAQIGAPRAIAESEHFVAVGGSLGWPQWNGRSVLERSRRRDGWEPVGIYRRDDVVCASFLTSRWPVNSIAIHPGEHLVAIGTGCYDGGYAFEGELLIHDLERGTTRSVLHESRTVQRVSWLDGETLEVTMPPPTDDDLDLDWTQIPYETVRLTSPDWGSLDDRTVGLQGLEARPARPPAPIDNEMLNGLLPRLGVAAGPVWQQRRQAWALAADPAGVVVGLDGTLERWTTDGELEWRRAVPGIVTQLLALPDNQVLIAVWDASARSYDARDTSLAILDQHTGAVLTELPVDGPRIAIARADGCVLLRDTSISSSNLPRAAHIVDRSGKRLGAVELGRYDLLNHYLDVQDAEDFLVLVGISSKEHVDKHVAAVRQTSAGRWVAELLYGLAWEPGWHLFGGAALLVRDDSGEALIHAGRIHQGQFLLGNSFVARRSHPDGRLVWEVRLDDTVSDLISRDGVLFAATNVGEIVQIDARDGRVLSTDRLELDGWPVVPLSLAAAGAHQAWVGTMDGRVALVDLRESPACG